MIHPNYLDIINDTYPAIILLTFLCIIPGIIFLRFYIKNPKILYGINPFKHSDGIEIYEWLEGHSSNSVGYRNKSIQEISEGCHITEKQARIGCFNNPYIHQLNNTYQEMWTIYPNNK